MSAKVIPFKRPPLFSPSDVPPQTMLMNVPFWARAAFKMLYKNVRAGVYKPRRMFVCLEQDGQGGGQGDEAQLHYLNLGYEPQLLLAAVTRSIQHMADLDPTPDPTERPPEPPPAA